MSDTFCALPFQHLSLGPEGTAQICCVSGELVTEHGAPMSLNIHTMDEIWNSSYMRNVRRAMLKGERIEACNVCYRNEAATGQSYRTWVGLQTVGGQPIGRSDMLDYGASASYRLGQTPDFLTLKIDNICNLKCRMCWGSASSEIERDPVHSVWSGSVEPLSAIWRGESARIGPEPRIGIRQSGLFAPEFIDNMVRCWTDGHAILNVPLRPGTQLAGLEITFHPDGVCGQQFQIVINGRPSAKGALDDAAQPVAVNLEDFGEVDYLSIEILSNRIVEAPGERECGIPLSGVVLRRSESESHDSMPEILSPRLETRQPWYRDDDTLFRDVLKSARTLRRLYIAGGEPLINQRVAEILDFLIEQGAANDVFLEIVTNCTHYNSHILGRLKNFRKIHIILSIDGIEGTYEYIRYPARWGLVEQNIKKFKEEFGSSCQIIPVVQIYNVLRLTDLYRFCDAIDIDVSENILNNPDWLAIHNLPPKVRKAAAAKLLEYLNRGCPPKRKPSILSLVRYLDRSTLAPDPKIIKDFMLFTNDLDVTRGQDFRTAHPELVELLSKDGFSWTADTLHAKKGAARRRPARERVFAWL